jgi:hypothetical protein
MVAPIAVIGAVAGTVGTINTIKNWVESVERFVREFQEAGHQLLKLKTRIGTCEDKLRLWWEFWALKGASYPYVRELWGSKSAETILTQLVTIESICDDINTRLDSFFGDTSLAQQIRTAAGGDMLEATSSRLAVFQVYAKKIKLVSSNTAIFSFVRTLKSRALEWLSELGLLLTELESGALRAFNIRHGQDASASSKQERENMIRAGVLMQKISENGDSVKELFKVFFPMETGGNNPSPQGNCALPTRLVKLKLGLVDSSQLELRRPSFDTDITETYHLLLRRERRVGSPREAELCVFRSFAEAKSQFASSVIEACQVALESGMLAAAQCQDSIFRFRPPLELDRLTRSDRSDRSCTPLKGLLGALNSDTFLLPDRIYLAYKVVECGALLIGTPWLESLKTGRLERSRTRAGFYYTLDIWPRILAVSPQGNNLCTQILLIGTLLIEIGTGMMLRGISYRGQALQFELEKLGVQYPLHQEPAGSSSYTEEEVKAMLIQNNFGDKYTSAALHCFGCKIREKCCDFLRSLPVDLSDNVTLESKECSLELKKEVLKDFFLNVYSK